MANRWDFEVEELQGLGVPVFVFGGAFKPDAQSVNEQKEWVGMPDFEAKDEPLKIVVNFETEDDRAKFQKKYNLSFLKKEAKTWSTWFPFKEREDLASLKYEQGF